MSGITGSYGSSIFRDIMTKEGSYGETEERRQSGAKVRREGCEEGVVKGKVNEGERKKEGEGKL